MELELIAHRGYSAIAPENTLSAFTAAISSGADGIEFDVQLSADGVPVVIHDATVYRTTNGTGYVRELTWQQLQKLDAGSWFHIDFTGEKIPTLAATLDLESLQEKQFNLYIEVKQAHSWSDLNIKKLLLLLQESSNKNNYILASFNSHFLERVRQLNTNITIGYHVAKPEDLQIKLERSIAASNSMLLCEYHLLLAQPSLLKTAQQQSIELVAWTVDRRKDLEQLKERGIFKIISNSLLGAKYK